MWIVQWLMMSYKSTDPVIFYDWFSTLDTSFRTTLNSPSVSWGRLLLNNWSVPSIASNIIHTSTTWRLKIEAQFSWNWWWRDCAFWFFTGSRAGWNTTHHLRFWDTSYMSQWLYTYATSPRNITQTSNWYPSTSSDLFYRITINGTNATFERWTSPTVITQSYTKTMSTSIVWQSIWFMFCWWWPDYVWWSVDYFTAYTF